MPLSSNGDSGQRGGQRAGEQMSLLMRVGSTGSFVLERAASHFNGAARRAVAVDRVCSDPRMRLDHLLGKLNFQFTKQEEAAIQRAFYCKDCKDTTTTCHQIRAVYDAFHLSWYPPLPPEPANPTPSPEPPNTLWPLLVCGAL